MEVWRKQTLLAYLGYLPYQDIDNVWGDQTQGATEAFQRDYQLTVDGVFGNGTLARILEVIATGEEPAVAEDNNVGNKTGTFWDHIRHWSRDEFKCRCGEYHAPYCNGFPVEPNQTLVELVDDIREHFDRPGIRSSGIRCYQHNIDSNGVKNSKHMSGKALDFFIEGISGETLRAYAAADPRCSYTYVINPGEPYVHVDVD